MTRKHFEAIADALRASRPVGTCSEWRATCWRMAVALAQFNTNFDTDRFIEACEK